jgi:AraC family transcriptional regulator
LHSLSSTAANWKGLVVQVFQVPKEIESLMVPAISDISLLLHAGGALHTAYRSVNSPWQEVQMHQGDLSLSPNGGTVQEEMRWKNLSGLPTQFLQLRLSKGLLAGAAQDVLDCDLSSLFLPARVGFQDPLLTQIGLALWRELEQPAPASNLYAQAAAQMLAVHLLRHYTSKGSAVKERKQNLRGLTGRQLKQVVDFILAHLSQDLSLEDLASLIGFSPSHFARLFRQTTGESPHQFVLHQRVERARHLLQETDASLVQIAAACGFANQSHLTAVFKDHFGLTPRAYRRDY